MKLKETIRGIIREEVKKSLKESDDLEGLYDVIDNPTAVKLQKAIDAKYSKLYNAIDSTPVLNSILDAYTNRTDSFETAEDFKNYNEGLIQVFTMAIKDLKKVNSLL